MVGFSLRANVDEVRRRVDEAARRSHRNTDEIKIIAVSKHQSVEAIKDVADTGIISIGENRVQELLAKKKAVPNVEWHLIGSLQRNKVKRIVGSVALVQSVDGLELAGELDKRAREADLVQSILVQVNVSGEQTKQGVSLKNLDKLLLDIDKLGYVKVEGLMTIAPLAPDVEETRPIFAELQESYGRLKKNLDFKWLSMGMTNDFEVAIEEGSNMVRIGRAIFSANDKGAQ